MTNARRPVGMRNSAPSAAPSLYSEVSSHSEGLNEGPHSEHAARKPSGHGGGALRIRHPKMATASTHSDWHALAVPDSPLLYHVLSYLKSELRRISRIGGFGYVTLMVLIVRRADSML